MSSLLKQVSNFFKKNDAARLPPQTVFELFRKVLKSNNRALEIIADMGEKLSGDYIFDERYIVTSINELKASVFQSVESINHLDSDNHILYEIFDRLTEHLTAIMTGKDEYEGPIAISLDAVSSEHYGIVGGKSAHLAAMIRHMHLNIPDGFCLTTNAYHQLIEYNNISSFIDHFELTCLPDPSLDSEPIRQQITQAILKSKPPPALLEQLTHFLAQLTSKFDSPVRIAVRSSARDEDMEFSFAGQFHTELCVLPDALTVFQAYLKVVASLFSRKVLEYRRRFFPDHPQMSIACCCQVNIDAAVSGVMYTSNIDDPGEKSMIVAGTWGQGTRLVEGKIPSDTYVLQKTPPFPPINEQIQRKGPVFYLDLEKGIVERELTATMQSQPCLSQEQIQRLGKQGLTIENYFNRPQDIEWCFDKDDQLYILQSRPLKISRPHPGNLQLEELLSHYEILTENQGSVAQQGIATGLAFIPKSAESLDDFPPGAILVARSDSSRFVRVMHRASAIITEVGTPVSHMSTLCREFQVPCLVNVPGILEKVSQGMELTLDTEDRTIYRGRVPELLTYQLAKPSIHEKSKETLLLRRLIGNISRLHLVDPFMDDFTPENCYTYHDLLRFIHEKAVLAMVNIGKDERKLSKNNLVRPLQLPISTGILVIDIGGGVSSTVKRRTVDYEDIISNPFKAILKGMLHPDAWNQDAMNVGLRDMMHSMLRVPTDLVDGQYTGRNIAVITHNYVNLCFRFGYHFNIIDAYCDDVTRENHIYFRFLGGATDITKRSRRAKLIAGILQNYDFRVDIKGDLVIARIGNKLQVELDKALDILGRLIGFTRQLDVHLDSDDRVNQYKEAFLNENYNIQEIQYSKAP